MPFQPIHSILRETRNGSKDKTKSRKGKEKVRRKGRDILVQVPNKKKERKKKGATRHDPLIQSVSSLPRKENPKK